MKTKRSQCTSTQLDGYTRKRKLQQMSRFVVDGPRLIEDPLGTMRRLISQKSTTFIQHAIGQFGIRKKIGRTMVDTVGWLHAYPSQHLSAKDEDICHSVCGDSDIIISWYNRLPEKVIKKFEKTGFQPLMDGLANTLPDTTLLRSLAEKWWDTTHTFHFENMGEMTMTPTDFTAITGLRVAGNEVKFDKSIHRRKEALIKYLGPPIAEILGRSVEIKSLDEAYKCYQPQTIEEEDMLLRAFVIGLLGSTIFAGKNHRVSFWYLPMLKEVKHIRKYNWGGAALTFLYQQMDDICRGNTVKFGGLWKAWEVWAREYITPTRVIEESTTTTNFPFSIRWKDSQPPTMEYGVLLQYYRIKLLDLQRNEVNWAPWGQFYDLQKVKDSQVATSRRILLPGPYGAEWYLGERVSIQSLSTDAFFVPKAPPQSMIVPEILSIVTEHWATDGKPALEFVESTDQEMYNEFRRYCFSSSPSIQGKIERGESNARKNIADNSSRDDGIPIPPWTLLLPSTTGGPNVICIPKDVGIDNLQIPQHVKHISIDTAKKLLSMIGGLQHVLIDQLTNARELLRDYNVIIQRLKHQLEMTDKGYHLQIDHDGQQNYSSPIQNHHCQDVNKDTASTD